MNPQLKRLLDHLGKILDPVRQAAVQDRHVKVASWQEVDRLPLIMCCPVPDDAPFQPYPHSEVFDEPWKMLYNELVHAHFAGIACRDRIHDDLPCTVRADFGTVVMASLFGARVEQIEENPPWARNLQSFDEYRAALDRDPLDFSQGWCPRVVERYQFYHQTLADYPELKRLIKIVLPDLQGPLDTAELLRGSDIYVDFYEHPDLTSRILNAIATAQVGFAKHLAQYITDGPEGYSHQHAALIVGNILIRNDSTVNISPEMYTELVGPHDEYVMREMGGGGLHSCGKIDHNIRAFLKLPSIRTIDIGQSYLNDMDAIYAAVKQHKVFLDRVLTSEEDLLSGRVMERFPTGMSLAHMANSLQDAKRIMAEYRKATE